MSTIFVKGLVFDGIHDVSPEERKRAQPFGVDVELEVDIERAEGSDRLEDTVDYKRLKSVVQAVIQGSPRNLVEKLASDIAEKILLADSRICSTTVSVKKLGVWDNGIPGVVITKKRN